MLNTMQKTALLYVAKIKKHFFLTDPLYTHVSLDEIVNFSVFIADKIFPRDAGCRPNFRHVSGAD